MLDFVDDWL